MPLLKKIWSVTWRILVFVLLWAGLNTPLILPVISKTVPHTGALPPWLRLYVETISAVTILIAAWIMVRFIDRRPFVSLGFNPRDFIRDTLVGLVVGLGMMTACAGLLCAFGWATWSATGVFAQSALAMATLAMLINTVTQEVMVRGYVQQNVQSRFGPMNGVIFSALFFLALHVGAIRNEILPAISLFAAGILLGTCYALSGNLWLPIGLHFGWNVLQGPVLGQAVSGQALDAGSRLLQIAGPQVMTGGKFGLEGGLIAIAITILGTPVMLLIYRQKRTQAEVESRK